ncbi:MAG: LOG family protein [Bacteroidetes bacterium]|nr:MAG: LOG family protein [Bacteroidota bacterium]
MKRPKLLKAPKAYKNPGFLGSRDARPLRILSEFLEPLSRFNYYDVKDTVVFFGSARIKPRKETVKALRELARKGTGDRVHSKKYHQELLNAEIAVEMSRYYEDATELSRLVTQWSKRRRVKNRLLVCSGGGPGIMEAANKGAMLAKGESIGLNISLPFEQYPNQFITPKFNFEFHYFFMRKLWFMYLAKGLVAFPGGFGTLDEFFELLTLLQTQKVGKKMTVILYGKTFWSKIIDFRALVKYGMISAEDLELFAFADTPKEAFRILTASIKQNYPEYR